MKTLMNYLNSVLNYGYETLLYLLFDINSNNVIDHELLNDIKIDGFPNLNVDYETFNNIKFDRFYYNLNSNNETLNNSNNETLNNGNKETDDNICCEIV
jgi:hypothetical protein